MKGEVTFGLVVSMILAAAWASPQAAAPTAPAPIPAAKVSQVECSGFISAAPVPSDIYVFEGADNDFREPYRVFSVGQVVFLHNRSKGGFRVGAEYRLVRPAMEPMLASWFYPSLTPNREFGHGPMWYDGQRWSIRSLGKSYEDVGRVKVAHTTSQGAVAEVTFACGTVEINDIAIPYQPRQIPTYTPTKVDRFPLPEGKLWGTITAAPNNDGLLGDGGLTYINLGESDGVHPGQRFRIFPVDRDLFFEGYFHPQPDIPTETTGELVVLSTQEKSSVAIIVSARREISPGDGIVSEQ